MKTIFALGICLLASLPASAQQQPQLQEEVIVRWWLVPVYAVDKAGAPVLNLAPEDFEVYIKGIKVDPFTLHKKEFKVTETKTRVSETPVPRAPAQKKMVFLVFDALFSPYNLLAKAKTIADQVIAQSDKSAQYVLLSIEPMAGLHYACGPTQDLKLLSKEMKKYIVGKKQDYLLQSNEIDRNSIRNVYPGSGGIPFSPREPRRSGQVPGSSVLLSISERNSWRDAKRMGSVFTTALMTLNVVLGNFREYSKVIYLYSCGIPTLALEDRLEYPVDLEAADWSKYFSPDIFSIDSLTLAGRYFNASGALLFLVNPAGTRTSEADKNSGEASLRLLADESGGRYYEGAEKQIAREVNDMEGGYYEISFPDKAEYEGQELSFEIRSRRSDVQIFTVRRVGREKAFAEMTELEKEVLVLNILNKGPYAETMQHVTYVEGQAFRDGGSLACSIPVPAEQARSEWSVFKVRRNFDTGEIQMEKEQIVPESPACEVRMTWKGQKFRHDIVLANLKTGTILVWK